ncbi:hypothetical protein ACFLTH_07660 [Bacteroidota bacterium]
MRYLLIFLLILPFTLIEAQKIGKLAEEKPPIDFPDNIWGVDIMFGDGGIGIGTFLRKSLTQDLTAFADFSFSESKDDKEVDYYDIWGNPYTVGKANRVFIMPLNLGLQYRLFSKTLTENLRPYISLGIGPTLVLTTPYEDEFFKSFAKAEFQYAGGGYIGFGADFGLSQNNLIGLNIRYYVIRMFGGGVENLEGRFRQNLNHFYITLNIGIMY